MKEVAMIRVYLRFTGRVQGVGFRFFAQMNAEKYKITGWVKNMSDGSVTSEAQGTKLQIDQFIESMQIGHRFMLIEGIEKEEIPLVENERGYYVKY